MAELADGGGDDVCAGVDVHSCEAFSPERIKFLRVSVGAGAKPRRRRGRAQPFSGPVNWT